MDEEKKEKIIDKIRKILELSKNNPSQEEATAAALKAQQLLAQYHIEMADIEDVSEIDDIEECEYYTGQGNKWKYNLANVIARNFRCKVYSKNSAYIVFYGYETDAKIAKEVFESLFKQGKTLAGREYDYYKSMYGSGRGIMNSFYIGFIDGIKHELEKQCTALMIIVPEEVSEGFEKKTFGFKTMHRTMSYSSNEVKQRGFVAGREAMQKRAICG